MESFAVRPSRKVFDAALAAVADVVLAGALRWDRALAAADFEALAVAGLLSVFDALRAADLEVTSFLAMDAVLCLGKDLAGTGTRLARVP
ncbi:hypothetical protein GCM10023332_05320 [Luteimonas vadosa]|uniref:Acyl carrier protein n=1 Tax=Luteimonas vadosa TaxID=1165507 RepID=A0ABP9DXF2_9GAMM